MFSKIKYDCKSGLIVFLVALPLCLGIAQAQKVDLFAGLFAGVIGGIVVGAISGSSLSVSGPAAGLTTIVIASIESCSNLIPGHSPFEIFLTSLCLAGVFQIILGIIKAGIIGYYFPSSVIKGMLCGIGILLIAKEIPHFLGDDRDPQGDESFVQIDKENTITEILSAAANFSPGVLLVGIVCITVIIVWQTNFIKRNKILNAVPAPLLAVVVGILLNEAYITSNSEYAISNPQHLVNLPVITSATAFMSKLHFPDFSALGYYKVWEIGFLLCCVASLEIGRAHV